MQVSVDGLLCCTISNDQSVKIYDVVNYDMMFMMRLPYVPGAIEWVYREGDVKPKLAVSDGNTPFVHIYDTHSGSIDPITSKEVCAVVHIFLYDCCEITIGCLLYELLVNRYRFMAVL
jgi:peptidylprolyl isomerase domain and WD repeat-containing protein 1